MLADRATSLYATVQSLGGEAEQLPFVLLVVLAIGEGHLFVEPAAVVAKCPGVFTDCSLMRRHVRRGERIALGLRRLVVPRGLFSRPGTSLTVSPGSVPAESCATVRLHEDLRC